MLGLALGSRSPGLPAERGHRRGRPRDGRDHPGYSTGRLGRRHVHPRPGRRPRFGADRGRARAGRGARLRPGHAARLPGEPDDVRRPRVAPALVALVPRGSAEARSPGRAPARRAPGHRMGVRRRGAQGASGPSDHGPGVPAARRRRVRLGARPGRDVHAGRHPGDAAGRPPTAVVEHQRPVARRGLPPVVRGARPGCSRIERPVPRDRPFPRSGGAQPLRPTRGGGVDAWGIAGRGGTSVPGPGPDGGCRRAGREGTEAAPRSPAFAPFGSARGSRRRSSSFRRQRMASSFFRLPFTSSRPGTCSRIGPGSGTSRRADTPPRCPRRRARPPRTEPSR